MYGFIYITTNRVNGKRYIGKRKCHSKKLDDEYLGSGTILLQAVKKYGKNNFYKEIICECCDYDDLNNKEKYYIDLYDAVNSNDFYNMIPGGLGGTVLGRFAITDGVKVKYVRDDEAVPYLSNGWVKGKPTQSLETREKRAKSIRGIKRSDETREKMRLSALGKKPSDEARKRMSDAKIGKISSNAKKVVCIETGEIFDSMRKAASKYGVAGSASNICNCLKGKQETAFNLHWKYLQ